MGIASGVPTDRQPNGLRHLGKTRRSAVILGDKQSPLVQKQSRREDGASRVHPRECCLSFSPVPRNCRNPSRHARIVRTIGIKRSRNAAATSIDCGPTRSVALPMVAPASMRAVDGILQFWQWWLRFLTPRQQTLSQNSNRTFSRCRD
jgi:hypothetical protein